MLLISFSYAICISEMADAIASCLNPLPRIAALVCVWAFMISEFLR